MFTNTSLFASVFIGGLLISLLSTANTVYIQKETFQPKGAARDFFIGALLVTFLYQLIPDTITDFGGFLTDVKLPTFTSVQRGGGGYTGSSSSDFELQVGVPRF
jgi:hypothetical protein